MKITYKKLKDCKDYQIIVNKKVVGTIEYNEAYKRHPYTVYIEHLGRFVSNSGHDCFSTLAIAKKELKKSVTYIVKIGYANISKGGYTYE